MKQFLKLASRIATDPRSDRELLTSFAATRDSGAMAELFRRHAAAIRTVAADVCPSAADDVVQAAFLLLAERAGALAERESSAGWLFQVARRLALKARTAAARRVRHEATPTPSTPPVSPTNPLDDLSFREVCALVAEELARLPERLRVVLVLHYWEGATHAEAAGRLGCSVSTLRRRLEVGRERLGARLARRGLAGASVLTALTALHTQAMARPPLDARLVDGLASAATPADSLPGATLLRGAGGVGRAKLLGLSACVLVIGVGLAFGLTPRFDLAPPTAPPVGATAPPPVVAAGAGAGAGANADAPREALPAGAIAKLGTGDFHHGGIIARVFVSADSRYAISIGSTAIMSVWNVKTKLWDLDTGKELPLAKGKLPDLPGGTQVVTAVPLGKSLALLVAPRDRIKAPGEGPWLFDALSGETLAEISKSGYADGIAVHPDGKTVAAVNVRGDPRAADRLYEIRLWDLEKKKAPVELLKAQRHDIKQLQFSPDGRFLAVQYSGGVSLDVLDAQTGKVAFTAPDTDVNVEGPYDRFTFSPDGKLFAKEHRANKSLRTWNLADAKERPAIPCEDGNWGHVLAFDATGTRLGQHSTRGLFRLYDLATGKPVWEVPCKGGFLGGFDAAFTPDGKRLLTTEHEDLIVRDAKTGAILDTSVHRAEINHLDWSHDGKQVITWDRETGTPGRVWDAITGRQRMTISGPLDCGCAAMATSPSGSLVATAGGRTRKNEGAASVRLWSSVDGQQVANWQPKLVGNDPGVRHLWFAPDGKTLFGAARETLFPWDVATRTELPSIVHPFAHVDGVYPVLGDRVLLSGWLPNADGRPVHIFDDPLSVLTLDLKTGKESGPRIKFGQDGLRGASPDGRVVLRTSYRSPTEHRTELWDLTTGRSLGQIAGSRETGDSPQVAVGSFSPDGRLVSLGFTDGTVRVYERSTRTERLRFSHGARVRLLTYSPDGTRIASAGSRWGLIWDLTAPQVATPTSDAGAWAALAGNDGREGLAGLRYFADRSDDAVRYLKGRVRPIPASDPKQVAQWIEQLGADDFAERESASEKLAGVAEAARVQLTAAVEKSESPEARTRLSRILAPLGEEKVLASETLRSLRAVEALERIRTPAAKDLLKTLAGGAPEARLTQAAAAALKRLGSAL